MTLFRAMLPRRIMTMLCRLPAGMGALYGDKVAAPSGEGPAEAGAILVEGLALALWLPLLEVDASVVSSFEALAETSPRLLTLSPESTKAFLQPHGQLHVLLSLECRLLGVVTMTAATNRELCTNAGMASSTAVASALDNKRLKAAAAGYDKYSCFAEGCVAARSDYGLAGSGDNGAQSSCGLLRDASG